MTALITTRETIVEAARLYRQTHSLEAVASWLHSERGIAASLDDVRQMLVEATTTMQDAADFAIAAHAQTQVLSDLDAVNLALDDMHAKGVMMGDTLLSARAEIERMLRHGETKRVAGLMTALAALFRAWTGTRETEVRYRLSRLQVASGGKRPLVPSEQTDEELRKAIAADPVVAAYLKAGDK